MLIDILSVEEQREFACGLLRGWQIRFPQDTLELEVVSMRSRGGRVISGGSTVSGLPVMLARQLKLVESADLFLVVDYELNDTLGSENLSNLVLNRVFRGRLIQPVVAVAENTPLSRRQLSETGFSGVYLRGEHPRRNAEQWGKILASTWHISS